MKIASKSIVGRGHGLNRRKLIVASAALAAVLASSSAQAASANWNATATNGIWEAAVGETNWSTGAATSPGVFPPGSPANNADVATFNAVSNNTTISINSTAGNSSSLNLGGITFTGANLSSYTLGSTSGNALVMTSNATRTDSPTVQIVISGAGRGAPTTAVTETINSPILLAAQSSGAGGFYNFQNNSTVLSNTDKLIFNGAISAAAETAAAAAGIGAELTLQGSSQNINNAINGIISNGDASVTTNGGLAVLKSGNGVWTLAGNNTYTGSTNVTGAGITNGAVVLRITGNYTGGGAINVTAAGTMLITGSANVTYGAVTLAPGNAGGVNFASTGTGTFGAISMTGANATFTVTSGTATVGQISENAASASRSVSFNGGIVKMTADYGAIPGVMNLNGGTITNFKSPASTLTIDSFLTNSTTVHNINVGANGGSFDTTVGNITSLASLNGTTATSIVHVTGGNTLKAASTAASTYIMSVEGTSTWDYNGAAGQVGGLSGSGTITNSGTAATLTENIASGTQTFSGNIGGGNVANVSFTKSGAGTQIFSGTNNYTGATTINAGTLNVSGSVTASAIAVNSPGTLIVNGGSVSTAVTVNSGGTLAGNGNGSTTGVVGSVVLGTSGGINGEIHPGVSGADGSIGMLAVTGLLDGTNGGERFDLSNSTTAGVGYDSITAGSATFSAANTFTLLGTPLAGTYTLVQSSTALGGAGPTVVAPTGTRSTFTPHYADVTSGPNAFTLVVAGNSANLIWTGANSNVWVVNSATDKNWNNTTSSINPDVFFNLDTVTLTNGAANESIALNTTVQPSSVLVDNDGSNPYSIAGSGGITGSGTTLTKQGVGTLVLATNNSYAGNTTFSGGTLQVGSGGLVGTLGTGTTTLSNNAALVFNRSDSPTLSTAVNGAGSVEQKGSGTLIITSSNNWSGSTIIDTGSTLQLGNGGATGNLGVTSDVQDNGTLAFNRNNTTGAINAPITGTGSLHVILGTLSLGANNSYGATTIDSGATLQIGTGGITGSLGTGALTNNGTLAFNHSDNVTVPTLGGSGALQQNGTGTLNLPGANSYGGATTISNGILAGQNPNSFGDTPAITISNVAGTVSFQSDTSVTFKRSIANVPYDVNLSATGGTINVDQATPSGTTAKTITIGNINASASTSGNFALTLTGGNSTGLTAGNITGPTLTTGTANVTINNNNTSGTTTIASYQQSGTTGALDNITFQGNGSTVINGGISTTIDASLNIITGNVTILGASSYTGGTIVGYNNTTPPGPSFVTVAVGNGGAFGGIGLVNLNAPAPEVGTLMSATTSTIQINNPISHSTTYNFGSATGPTGGNLIFGNPGTTSTWFKGQFAKNIIVNCPVMTINDVITNTSPGNNGTLGKDGPGMLVLTNNNTYDSGTSLIAGTLVIANGTNGSATGTGTGTGPGGDSNVTLNGGVLASDNSTPATDGTTPGAGGGTIGNNVVAGTGAHTIAPGGIGSIGFFNINGLTSTTNTTLNFDVPTVGAGSGVVTTGDLITLGSGLVSIGSGTKITVGGTTNTGNDYRLIGDNSSGTIVNGITLANFTLPAAPSGQGYSLSTSVDPGFIDLVVSVVTGPANLVWSGGTAAWDIASSSNWNAGAAQFHQGDIVTFDNTVGAGSKTVTINTTNVQPASVAVNGSQAYIFNGTAGIANAPSGPATTLAMTGTGSLTISTVNTYTGATTIGTGSDTPALTLTSAGKIASTAVTVAAGATANINGVLTGTPNVVANGAVTLGVNDGVNGTAGSILVRNWGTLNVGAAGNVTLTATTSANHAQRTVLVLNSGAANPLTNAGKIQLSNNDMIIQHGDAGLVSSAGSIANQIKAGFGTPATYWNGTTGIASSSAASDTRFLTALGYATGGATGVSSFDGFTTAATDVLVKYTYYGDADLNGTVDGGDYAKIDAGFGLNKTGWQNGDFNYDGVVNGSDFALIDNVFNQITATGATSLAIVANTSNLTASPANLIAAPAALSSVPEPTTLGLLGIGAMGLLGRRKRKCEFKNEMSV